MGAMVLCCMQFDLAAQHRLIMALGAIKIQGFRIKGVNGMQDTRGSDANH